MEKIAIVGPEGSPLSEVFSKVEKQSEIVESEHELSELFARRRLPRSYHWLYKRSADITRAQMPSTLDKMCDDGAIAALGDGTWSLEEPKGDNPAVEDFSDKGASPPWEDDLASYLTGRGVPVQRRRTEGGFVLALAMTAFAARMNVEIDGRQHRLLQSQRAKDIARDQRLKAIGWSVLRLEVSDVVNNVAACGEKVVDSWNKLKERGTIE